MREVMKFIKTLRIRRILRHRGLTWASPEEYQRLVAKGVKRDA